MRRKDPFALRPPVLVAVLLLGRGASAYAPPLRAARAPLPRAPPPRLAEEASAKTPASPPFSFLQPNAPDDQQAIAELRQLKRQSFMDWPIDKDYYDKLFGLWQNVMLFASLPISYVTYDQLPQELPQLFLAANIGTLAVMIPFVARLRITWGITGARLRDRATYYEANQRGLFARKDRGTQLRDRLVNKEEVQPALFRMDISLAAITAGLALTLFLGEVLTLSLGEAGPSTLKTLSGQDAVSYENRLRSDRRQQVCRARAEAHAAQDERRRSVPVPVPVPVS